MRRVRLHCKSSSRATVEEQRAQKHDRFLRGRQFAYMIYDHFRAAGACEAVQGLPDLLSMRLQNDDVEDFDTRWDQPLQGGARFKKPPLYGTLRGLDGHR